MSHTHLFDGDLQWTGHAGEDEHGKLHLARAFEIRFEGKAIGGRSPRSLLAEGIAFVPQGRNLFGSLHREKEYIVYCQSGRRSSAAAFLLSQRGYKAHLLEGGFRGSAG